MGDAFGGWQMRQSARQQERPAVARSADAGAKPSPGADALRRRAAQSLCGLERLRDPVDPARHAAACGEIRSRQSTLADLPSRAGVKTWDRATLGSALERRLASWGRV